MFTPSNHSKNVLLQVFQEETEFQQGIDDVRGRRRAAGAAGASQQPSQAAMIAQQEQQAAQQLKDAALLYARCLQHLLKVGMGRHKQLVHLFSRPECEMTVSGMANAHCAPASSAVISRFLPWMTRHIHAGLFGMKMRCSSASTGAAHAAASCAEPAMLA